MFLSLPVIIFLLLVFVPNAAEGCARLAGLLFVALLAVALLIGAGVFIYHHLLGIVCALLVLSIVVLSKISQHPAREKARLEALELQEEESRGDYEAWQKTGGVPYSGPRMFPSPTDELRASRAEDQKQENIARSFPRYINPFA